MVDLVPPRKSLPYSGIATANSDLFSRPLTLHQRDLLLIGTSMYHLFKRKERERELETLKAKINTWKNHTEEERF